MGNTTHKQVAAVNQSGLSLILATKCWGPTQEFCALRRLIFLKEVPVSNTSTAAPVQPPVQAKMSHRQIMEALIGLLLAMFVSMVSSTVVSNALPTIVTDLNGTQTGLTWIVVATLLTMTATTPIWGKFADLFDNKMLVQLSLVIFMAGSLLAGFATSMGMLIGARAIQGIGVGGLTALVQVIIAKMVTPRERGRYSGYIGATFAMATVSGPLIGGVLVEQLSWEWCFWFGVPLAVLAFAALQKTLKVEFHKTEVKVDYVGAFLLMAGISLLLAWVSLAGKNFDWVSGTSGSMVAGSIVLIVLSIVWEGRFASDPVIPLRLFNDRTTALATAASVMIGFAMFGAVTYLSQYFQMARGMSPTKAGLMSIFMVGGLFVSSVVSGKIITATGLWKRWLVGGMVLVIAGLGLLALIDEKSHALQVGGSMVVLGLGLGMTMQNLVLAVQNNTANSDMGAASSVVAFFRSIGGSVGVAGLGALLTTNVSDHLGVGLKQALGEVAQTNPELAKELGAKFAEHQIPSTETLFDMGAAPVAHLMESSYGSSMGELFLIGVPFAVIALILVLFIKEVPLRTTILREDEIDKVAAVTGVDEAID